MHHRLVALEAEEEQRVADDVLRDRAGQGLRALALQRRDALVGQRHAAGRGAGRIELVGRKPVVEGLRLFLHQPRAERRAAQIALDGVEIGPAHRAAHRVGDVEIGQRLRIVRDHHRRRRRAGAAAIAAPVVSVIAIAVVRVAGASVASVTPAIAAAAIATTAVAVIVRVIVRYARTVGLVDAAELQETVGAVTGEDVGDAIMRLGALFGRQLQKQFLLLVAGVEGAGADHVGDVVVPHLAAALAVAAREVVPDIGFDGIVVTAVAGIGVDVAELHLRQEIAVLPRRLAPHFHGGLQADVVHRVIAVGVVGCRTRQRQCRGRREERRHGQHASDFPNTHGSIPRPP